MFTSYKKNTAPLFAAAFFAVTSLVAGESVPLVTTKFAPIETPEIPASSTLAPVTQTAADYSDAQILGLLNTVAEQAPYLPLTLSSLLEELGKDTPDERTHDRMLQAITKLLAVKIAPEQRIQLNEIQAALLKKLQDYKVSGPAFTADFNGAFFVDWQNPIFTATFKDANGNTKKRTYQADISLIGLNVELALRLDCVFFTNPDFNFYDTNKVIELGTGIQINPFLVLSWFIPFFELSRPTRRGSNIRLNQFEATDAWLQGDIENHFNYLNIFLSRLNITYVPFNNAPGGLFIVGFPLGLGGNSLALVRGGTLTPVPGVA